MSNNSEQAAVEVTIHWEQDGISHCNRQYFDQINFWRDIFPGALSDRLTDSGGEPVSELFPPGELLPPWSDSRIYRVKRSALNLQRRQGPPLELQRGRHYPRYIAAGTADIFPGNMQPMRVTELDDTHVTLDLNHPLARSPLTVTVRIDQRLGIIEEHGGRCSDVLMKMLNAGIGLESLHAAGSTDYFSARAFDRMDPREDALFYSQPRLVQHIDSTAVANITGLYARLLQPGMQVLDLMSSWVSHLPDTLDGLQVTGLGMNARELEHNALLAHRVVHDLNTQPLLPLPDNSFDAVVCTVSVEYLVDPVTVFRELARVLKPGAPAIVTFSDRWFPTKAIALWGDLHPFERLALVQEYFRQAAGFGLPTTETVRGFPRPQDDKYAGQLQLSDPIFAAWATASG